MITVMTYMSRLDKISTLILNIMFEKIYIVAWQNGNCSKMYDCYIQELSGCMLNRSKLCVFGLQYHIVYFKLMFKVRSLVFILCALALSSDDPLYHSHMLCIKNYDDRFKLHL